MQEDWSGRAGEADRRKMIKVGDAMLQCLGFIFKSVVCHGSSLSGGGGGSSSTSDPIRFALIKDPSAPSVEGVLEGVSTDWRPGESFAGGIGIQERIGKGLKKGSDSRIWEKKIYSQAKM